jgi:hypothetical protein
VATVRLHFPSRLPALLLGELVVLVPFAACTHDAPPPASAPATLAQIGPKTSLNALANGNQLTVNLRANNNSNDGNSDPCPVVSASAAVNGAAMNADSHGGGTSEPYGDGISCGGGPYMNLCNDISFDGTFDAASTSDLEFRVQDASATYAFHAQIIKYTASFEPPYDGVLHAGSWVNVAVSPPLQLLSPSGFSIDFYAAGADASAEPVFTVDFNGSGSCTADGDGGGCLVRLTKTGVSFQVPNAAARAPVAGTLHIDGIATTNTLECAGPMDCELDVVPSLEPALQTAFGR